MGTKIGLAVFATALAVCAPSAAAPIAPPYSSDGPYVEGVHVHSNIFAPKIKLGTDGLPLVHYDGIGWRPNPVTTAQYGLWAYGYYKAYLADDAHRAIVVKVADWLVAHQAKDGRWLYGFPFAYDGVALKPPWGSALAQGQAMSLLERAYVLTSDERYKTSAVRALASLLRPVSAGGFQRCLLNNCHYTWLEEYPTTPPTFVLNGFMYTLVGLYDLSVIAPDTKARMLYEAGRAALYKALPLYDINGIASYDLTQRTVKGQKPFIPSQGYEQIHIGLLQVLDQLKPNTRFRYYARRWQANIGKAPAH